MFPELNALFVDSDRWRQHCCDYYIIRQVTIAGDLTVASFQGLNTLTSLFENLVYIPIEQPSCALNGSGEIIHSPCCCYRFVDSVSSVQSGTFQQLTNLQVLFEAKCGLFVSYCDVSVFNRRIHSGFSLDTLPQDVFSGLFSLTYLFVQPITLIHGK